MFFNQIQTYSYIEYLSLKNDIVCVSLVNVIMCLNLIREPNLLADFSWDRRTLLPRRPHQAHSSTLP